MGLMDILQQYMNPAAGTPAGTADDHFDEVAQSVPQQTLQGGLADAFRSDQTPPFAQMVSHLFGQSNPQQQAGMLNQLLGSLGPGMLAGLGGGMLGNLLGGNSGAPQVTAEQAAQLSPQEVQQLASHAEQQNPGVVDRIGSFYAQHPQLVKTLGSAALAVVLAKMANRSRS